MLLGDVAVLALDVARREADGGGSPPRRLRPMLGFRGGPLGEHATAVVLSLLDEDDGFRDRVAAAVDEGALGTPGEVFLRRPEGWGATLDGLVEAEEDRRRRDAEADEERSASHRLRRLERTLDELQERADAATAAAARASQDLDAERGRRRVAERGALEVARRAAVAESERDRAVAELTVARREADERLARLRDVESLLSELRRGRATWSAPALDGLDSAQRAMEAALAAIGEASEHLRRPPGGGAGRAAPGTGGAAPGTGGAEAGPRIAASAGRGRQRRTPVRLERGAVDGTTEATDQLLRTSEVIVLVDGYNVSQSGWPHLDATAQRASLQSMLTSLVARTSAEVCIVFDGDDDGRGPAVSAPLAVRVRYTSAGVEADDVLIEMVDEIRPDRPVVVVSSDRRVRDGAAAAGANTVSSAALLAWCRR